MRFFEKKDLTYIQQCVIILPETDENHPHKEEQKMKKPYRSVTAEVCLTDARDVLAASEGLSESKNSNRTEWDKKNKTLS